MRGPEIVPRRIDPIRAACWLTSLGALLCALAFAAGCTRDDSEGRVAAMNDSNIRRLANLYKAFQLRKDMQGPKDEAEFRRFIQQEMSPIKLKRMQVDPNN